jgi:hypothetical protein
MKKKNTLFAILAGATFVCICVFYSGGTSIPSEFSFSGEPLAKTVIKTATEEDRAERAATWAADALFGFLIPEGE